MSVRQTIEGIFADVAREQHKALAPLTDDAALLELGLDSLCIAIIVARLGEELELDPFSAADEVGIPTTFGAFVALYENVGD
jgi:aryl carrier-like protein